MLSRLYDCDHAWRPANVGPMTMEAKGQNGRIVYDGQMVAIHRDSFIARGTVGRGVKAIPVEHIAAVQFKRATTLFRGYIQFTVPGGVERRSRPGEVVKDAMRDENSVVFMSRQNGDMEALYAAVMERISALRSAPQHAPDPRQGNDVAARMAQLHSLLEQGHVTPTEYDLKRQQLLQEL